MIRQSLPPRDAQGLEGLTNLVKILGVVQKAERDPQDWIFGDSCKRQKVIPKDVLKKECGQNHTVREYILRTLVGGRRQTYVNGQTVLCGDRLPSSRPFMRWASFEHYVNPFRCWFHTSVFHPIILLKRNLRTFKITLRYTDVYCPNYISYPFKSFYLAVHWCALPKLFW